MNKLDKRLLEFGNAICYSGYRQGQSPVESIYPTYEQIKEDLQLLENQVSYIRLYDANEHAQTVLKVIKKEKIKLKVMIGVCLQAEINNDNCPWGGTYLEDRLKANKKINEEDINNLIILANQYHSIVFSVFVGNEATVEWTDHLVPVSSLIQYVRFVKKQINQPVTFCENYVAWQNKLIELVDEVDFISMHTYPIWEYKTIDEALGYTIDNYYSVKNKYPNKLVMITEAGWATESNGRGIPPQHANEAFQKVYYEALLKWSHENEVYVFIFEAFDEDWKGSLDPLEPEKHWGLFTIERKSKLVLQGG